MAKLEKAWGQQGKRANTALIKSDGDFARKQRLKIITDSSIAEDPILVSQFK